MLQLFPTQYIKSPPKLKRILDTKYTDNIYVRYQVAVCLAQQENIRQARNLLEYLCGGNIICQRRVGRREEEMSQNMNAYFTTDFNPNLNDIWKELEIEPLPSLSVIHVKTAQEWLDEHIKFQEEEYNGKYEEYLDNLNSDGEPTIQHTDKIHYDSNWVNMEAFDKSEVLIEEVVGGAEQWRLIFHRVESLKNILNWLCGKDIPNTEIQFGILLIPPIYDACSMHNCVNCENSSYGDGNKHREAFISQDKAQKILDDYIIKLTQDAPTVADTHVRRTTDKPASKKQKTSSC